MGDGGSQTAHGSQAILHAHFTFEAANLGKIVEGIDKPKVAPRAHIKR